MTVAPPSSLAAQATLRVFANLTPSDLAAWDDLVNHASEPNPFAEYWLMQASINAFDPDGHVNLLWVATGDELVGVMAVEWARDYGRVPIRHMRNFIHPNMFLGTPMVRRGMEQQFWAAALALIDAPGTKMETKADMLWLRGLDGEGPLWTALDMVAARDGRPIRTQDRQQRALLAGPGPAAAYWERAVRAKKRKEIRRQAKRLSDEGTVRFRHLGPHDDVAPWVADFLTLERSGWKGAAQSALDSAEATRRFFQQVISTAHARGQLAMLALDLNECPIAMLIHLHSGRAGFSLKTAFNEDYARFSPGVLIQQENLALRETVGLDWIDSCAASDHPMIDHIWRERRVIANAVVGSRRAAARFRYAFVHHVMDGWHRVKRWRNGAQVSVADDQSSQTDLHDANAEQPVSKQQKPIDPRGIA